MRVRIVEATVAALAGLTAVDLVSAIGTREIARRAGTSAGSVFYHFGSVEELAAAVLARVFHPAVIPVDANKDRLETIAGSTLPLTAAFAMHGADFDRLTTDPELRVRLGLWSLGGAVADEAYREFLHATERHTYGVTERLFATWDRELRPPLDQRAFHALQVALLQGSAVRHLVDPHDDDRSRFVRAAASLSMVSLRVRGDRRDADDRLAEMNYYPLTDVRTGAAVTDRQRRARALILDAAARTFGALGYEAATMATVARAASISTSTLYNHFEGKSHLAVALFRKQAEDLAAVHRADARDLLVALAVLAAGGPEQAAPYLAQLAVHAPDASTDVLVETLSALFGAVALRPGLDADLAAHLAVTTVVGRVLGAPSTPPDDVAALALELLLA